MRKEEFKKLLETFEMKNIEEDDNDDKKNEKNNDHSPVSEWEKHEIALNELQEKALETYEKLFDLGINGESRFADKYLESAVKSLELAMEAEKTKINKKMEAIKIKLMNKKSELEERRLSLQEKMNGIIEAEADNDSVVIDRNKLLHELISLEEKNEKEENKINTKNDKEKD